jgi:predicted HicB family RNase H-like nuclease
MKIKIRVRPTLKAALEKFALQDKRTLSAFVELVLERAVEELQAKGKRR